MVSQRIRMKIKRLEMEIKIIEGWVNHNEAGIKQYSIGTRSLGYLDPLQLLKLLEEKQEELERLLYPGGRFKRAMSIR